MENTQTVSDTFTFFLIFFGKRPNCTESDPFIDNVVRNTYSGGRIENIESNDRDAGIEKLTINERKEKRINRRCRELGKPRAAAIWLVLVASSTARGTFTVLFRRETKPKSDKRSLYTTYNNIAVLY